MLPASFAHPPYKGDNRDVHIPLSFFYHDQVFHYGSECANYHLPALFALRNVMRTCPGAHVAIEGKNQFGETLSNPSCYQHFVDRQHPMYLFIEKDHLELPSSDVPFWLALASSLMFLSQRDGTVACQRIIAKMWENREWWEKEHKITFAGLECALKMGGDKKSENIAIQSTQLLKKPLQALLTVADTVQKGHR